MSVSRRAASRPPAIIFILFVLVCTFTAFYLSVITQISGSEFDINFRGSNQLQTGASPWQQGRADRSKVSRTNTTVREMMEMWRARGLAAAPMAETLVTMETTNVRGYLVPSDPSSSRSQLSEQSGELSDGPTHLFTLLSTGQQADSCYYGYLCYSATQLGAGPSHLVTCLWKSVSCL